MFLDNGCGYGDFFRVLLDYWGGYGDFIGFVLWCCVIVENEICEWVEVGIIGV